MYTINDLRAQLGLSTANQVRNRIEAIKDVLADSLRRGPNNQILIDENGISLLKQIQDLYDSGLTLREASSVIRSNAFKKGEIDTKDKPAFTRNQIKEDNTKALIAALKGEIAYLRERVTFLEERRSNREAVPDIQRPEWWEFLKEEVDGS